jgi:hypothetical protein
LLKAEDAALRESFYARFDPRKFSKWPHFASDGDHFMDRAMNNPLLWRTHELRESLNQLAWAHPDPHHSMIMPNRYKGAYEHMKQKHPSWFTE